MRFNTVKWSFEDKQLLKVEIFFLQMLNVVFLIEVVVMIWT